jgi:type I restriction enzyme S subunit
MMSNLPKGWKEEKLSELVAIKGGKRLPKDKNLISKKTEHPYIRITDLENHSIKKEQLQFITDDIFSNISKYIVNTNDIILSIVGTIGLVSLIDDDLNNANLTENCVKLTVLNTEALCYKYLFYYLISKNGQYEINKNSVGAVQKKLPIYGVEKINIILPNSYSEQKQIANILSSFDKKIELLKEQNQTLETMAQTIFKEWFVDSNEVSSKISDFIDFNPIEKIDKKREYLFFDMKTLSTTVMSMEKGVYKKTDSATNFRENDTLFSKITPCLENGKIGFVFNLCGENIGRGSTEFIVMRAKENGSPYLNYCLSRYSEFRNYAIKSMTGTSGRQRVSLDRLKDYEIKYDINLVKEFHQRVKFMFNKIKNNSEQIQTLEETRDSLLPKLMSGKIRLKDFDESN